MQMKTMKNILVMVGIGLALVIGGCSNTKHSTTTSSTPTVKPVVKPASKVVVPTTQPTAPSASTLAVKPTSNSVYFSYNRSNLEASASASVLDGYVSWLNDHSGVSVTVEGNCDERGSREYNLALGQARADRVKDYLVGHGVPASRIDTVSFGEERPACTDSGENCWAQNRRADIVAR
ncbi:MAG: peptidoglycan-associated lipoprotein Pal [Mariprofundaceae bacterium]|nr:peptidoglycan-associated lipoprotein Pal [Mariprofundaceae bacterium]